ncbi:succinylglutamate desuccinylase [Oceanisphaera avium]|uniref:Succinylglutamate desuccinylase n=1 Tax=Oceanisphaera avium TaxID=1903694 RepID=A0A1Y0CV24_9GAMM|nr:succinylglutamate desuccinylase [Oceanisphaera avium]ART79068.1 succinylglutamate desuccinylase [Oceanisphaera avium]
MNTGQLTDFLTISRANPHGLAPSQHHLACGSRIEVWDSGVLYLEPASSQDVSSNKDIIISCGIHGNETAPIEMCERLLKQIVTGQLVCQQRLLLIFGNLEGMNLAVREVDENLNRLFCGEHAKGQISNNERRRAAKLEHYVSRFYQARSTAIRLHYDLHTAIRASKYEQFAVYPYQASNTYSRRLLAFLANADIKTILLSHAPATTFSCYSAQYFAAESLTIELGKVAPFGKNDLSRLACLHASLKNELNDSEWQPQPLALNKLRVFKVCQEIIKHSEQFCLHFSEDVANFSAFAPNSLLASDEHRCWCVGAQEEVVIFPNAAVAVSHRAALMAVVTELTDKMLN